MGFKVGDRIRRKDGLPANVRDVRWVGKGLVVLETDLGTEVVEPRDYLAAHYELVPPPLITEDTVINKRSRNGVTWWFGSGDHEPPSRFVIGTVILHPDGTYTERS